MGDDSLSHMVLVENIMGPVCLCVKD